MLLRRLVRSKSKSSVQRVNLASSGDDVPASGESPASAHSISSLGSDRNFFASSDADVAAKDILDAMSTTIIDSPSTSSRNNEWVQIDEPGADLAKVLRATPTSSTASSSRASSMSNILAIDSTTDSDYAAVAASGSPKDRNNNNNSSNYHSDSDFLQNLVQFPHSIRKMQKRQLRDFFQRLISIYDDVYYINDEDNNANNNNNNDHSNNHVNSGGLRQRAFDRIGHIWLYITAASDLRSYYDELISNSGTSAAATTMPPPVPSSSSSTAAAATTTIYAIDDDDDDDSNNNNEPVPIPNNDDESVVDADADATITTTTTTTATSTTARTRTRTSDGVDGADDNDNDSKKPTTTTTTTTTTSSSTTTTTTTTASYYQMLLAQSIKDPATEQRIQKDLRRSFPNAELSSRLNNDKSIEALYNVLKALAVFDQIAPDEQQQQQHHHHHHRISYCQGMNYIAVLLLWFMSEEDAFWVMLRILYEQTDGRGYAIAGFYRDDAPILMNYIEMFDRLVVARFPKLTDHMRDNAMMTSMYVTEWFTTLFVYNLPLRCCCLAWHLFFVYGQSALFRIGLALMQICQAEILTLEMDTIISDFKSVIARVTAEQLLDAFFEVKLDDFTLKNLKGFNLFHALSPTHLSRSPQQQQQRLLPSDCSLM